MKISPVPLLPGRAEATLSQISFAIRLWIMRDWAPKRMKGGERDIAMIHLQCALLDDPYQEDVLNLMGKVHLDAGETHSAKHYYDRAHAVYTANSKTPTMDSVDTAQRVRRRRICHCRNGSRPMKRRRAHSRSPGRSLFSPSIRG